MSSHLGRGGVARRVAHATLSAGVVLLGGCVLVNPHVEPAAVPSNDFVVYSCKELTGIPAPKAQADGAGAKGGKGPTANTTGANVATPEGVARAKDYPGNVDPVMIGNQVCGGIELAQGYFLAYRSAVGWNAKYRNATAILSIALGALLVREGLEASPSSDKIADFGVALAGLYGLSTQLTSKPREKVYLNGMKAMSCAILEAQPLVIAASELHNLKPLVSGVSTARDTLVKSLSEAGLGNLTSADDTKYLQALADADNAISQTDEFAVEIAQASGQFAPLVQMIATDVSTHVVDTEASEQSLSDLLSGFGAKARGFAESAKVPKTDVLEPQSGDPKRVAAEAKVSRALADLKATTQALTLALAKVVNVATVASKVKACNDELKNAFDVEPNKSSVLLEQGKSEEFKVTVGSGMPSAALQGEKADFVTLGDVVAKDGKFHVRVTGKTPTGDKGPTLVISDGLGVPRKWISIAVAAAPNTDASNTNPANAPAPAISDEDKKKELARLVNAAFVPETTPENETASASVKVLQCVVGADVDGTVGSNTREAIRKFRKSTPTGVPEGIDEPLIGEVRAALDGDRKDCRQTS